MDCSPVVSLAQAVVRHIHKHVVGATIRRRLHSVGANTVRRSIPARKSVLSVACTQAIKLATPAVIIVGSGLLGAHLSAGGRPDFAPLPIAPGSRPDMGEGSGLGHFRSAQAGSGPTNADPDRFHDLKTPPPLAVAPEIPAPAQHVAEPGALIPLASWIVALYFVRRRSVWATQPIAPPLIAADIS